MDINIPIPYVLAFDWVLITLALRWVCSLVHIDRITWLNLSLTVLAIGLMVWIVDFFFAQTGYSGPVVFIAAVAMMTNFLSTNIPRGLLLVGVGVLIFVSVNYLLWRLQLIDDQIVMLRETRIWLLGDTTLGDT